MKKVLALFIAAVLLLGTVLVMAGTEITIPVAEQEAAFLQTLGILKGTEEGLELKRSVTRAEAVTMIVRLTGHEEEALLSSSGAGFTDCVQHWAFSYIGYAARNGIVQGTSDTTFEPERDVTGEEYTKMLLSALGFKGITLENAYDRGVETGLLDTDSAKMVVSTDMPLSRSDVARISYSALNTKESGGELLCRRLVNKGLYKWSDFKIFLGEQPIMSETFTDKLNQQIPAGKNYMFSPLSIKMAFAMAANGAQGDTQKEILDALQITDLTEFNTYSKKLIEDYTKPKHLQLEVANSIWLNTDNALGTEFSRDFSNTIHTYYNGEADTVTDKDALKTINGWVNEKTHEKIPEILNDPDFLACLVNAVYFKGQWANQFKEESTRKDTFTDRNGKKAELDFMRQVDTMRYYDGGTIQAVELPYKREEGLDISMYILMGDDKVETPEAFLENAVFSYERVDLQVPRFTIEYETELNDIMKALGIQNAFLKEKADFTPMLTKDLGTYINKTIHKTYIDVDENGTEAAAVTAVILEATSAIPDEPIEFIADKPFTFVIRDNTNEEILFIGEYAYTE